MASSISLPLVFWHNFSNPNVTCITTSFPHIYAGQKDGHIWVYTLSQDNLLQHKLLLVGHKSAIVALCVIKSESENSLKSEDILISASEDGEIARWNASDGRCQAVNPNGFYGIPRLLKVFTQFSDKHIFCCGQSNEITILHTTTLEVVRVWGGHSNWLTCIDFYDPDIKRSRLVTVTMDGKLDIWDFDSIKHVIYKDKSITQKTITDTISTMDQSVFDLIANKSMPDLCILLTKKTVTILAMIKDYEFVPQFSIPIEDKRNSWAGGSFFEQDRFVLWTSKGQIYEYSLHISTDESNKSSYSANLIKSYSFENTNLLHNENTITSILYDTNHLLAITILNHPISSSYSIIPLTFDNQKDHLYYSPNTTFRDIWPIVDKCDAKYGNITATAPVNTNHLAIGYDSGTICVVPISIALLHLTELSDCISDREDVRVFENAHSDSVTCMIVPERPSQQYLLSGGKEGSVKIWNLIDGKYVASCSVHSTSVEMFIEPSEQKDTRVRGCIVSIAQDNSIALISVESMSCLFMFPGNPYPLTSIQWRTTEDYLIFGYADKSAFVWQMQTAHLDRVLHGKIASDILSDNRWPINYITPSNVQKLGGNQLSTKQTATIRSILSKDYGLQITKSVAQVFTFNIRRLVHDIYTRASLLSQEGQQQHQQQLQNSNIHPVLKASMSSSSFDAVVPDILTFRPDKDDPLDTATQTSSTIRQKIEEIRDKRIELVTAIMSIVTSWNISEALEDICEKTLSLVKTIHPNISFGLKGANGNLSILAPLKNEKEAWTISASMTANRLLSIALLAKAILFIAEKETQSSDLISGYAMALPLVIGSSYCFPSLSLLSKYWQDPSARSLFSSAVTGLSKSDIEALVDYWEAFLPISSSPENSGAQMMARASIVLGIMGCDQPQMLSSRVRKSTALSLTILLSDAELDEARHTNSMARTLSSMELLSQGFSIWETYINTAEVLRTLFLYATDTQPLMALVSRGAKTAIFEISTRNMPLVINTLTFDTIRGKTLEDRLRCLKIIGIFIRREPILLYPHVYNVLEAVLATLDPNVAHMRQVMLSAATTVLHELVKTYPSVDFSSSAQKLAVGTLEGAAVIYDVRTATRSLVLEGHVGPVSVLSFSPDAKLIATCSLMDQTVRVWYTNQSLIGMLLGHRHQEQPTTGSQRPYKVFSFAMPDYALSPTEIIKEVRFEWTSHKCVKLHVQQLVMSFNV